MSCRNMSAHRMRVHVPTERSSIDSCIVAVRTPDAGRGTRDADAGRLGRHVLTVPGGDARLRRPCHRGAAVSGLGYRSDYASAPGSV